MFLQKIVSAEAKRFFELTANARVLTYVSTLFAPAWSAFGLFTAAFIMRKTGDVVRVVTFQLSWLTGVPIAAYAAAFLLRKFKSSTLYAASMLISSSALVVLTVVHVTGFLPLITAGLLYGLSNGLHWSNRNLLVLENTVDADRNYFFGIENFVAMFCGVVTPAAIGFFIVHSGDNPLSAYRWLAVGAFSLAMAAAFLLHKGSFAMQRISIAFPIRFDAVWSLFCGLCFFRGIVYAFSAILPAMLVARVLKSNEATLGLIQSVGAIASAVLMYVLGRLAKPKDRLAVWIGGAAVYAAGTAVNAGFFTPVAALVFMGCMILAQPTLELIFSPIQMAVIDRQEKRQPGSSFAYLCAFEVAVYSGRLTGGIAFLIAASALSGDFALRYVLLGIGIAQLAAIPVARALLSRLANKG